MSPFTIRHWNTLVCCWNVRQPTNNKPFHCCTSEHVHKFRLSTQRQQCMFPVCPLSPGHVHTFTQSTQGQQCMFTVCPLSPGHVHTFTQSTQGQQCMSTSTAAHQDMLTNVDNQHEDSSAFVHFPCHQQSACTWSQQVVVVNIMKCERTFTKRLTSD